MYVTHVSRARTSCKPSSVSLSAGILPPFHGRNLLAFFADHEPLVLPHPRLRKRVLGLSSGEPEVSASGLLQDLTKKSAPGKNSRGARMKGAAAVYFAAVI